MLVFTLLSFVKLHIYILYALLVLFSILQYQEKIYIEKACLNFQKNPKTKVTGNNIGQ